MKKLVILSVLLVCVAGLSRVSAQNWYEQNLNSINNNATNNIYRTGGVGIFDDSPSASPMSPKAPGENKLWINRKTDPGNRVGVKISFNEPDITNLQAANIGLQTNATSTNLLLKVENNLNYANGTTFTGNNGSAEFINNRGQFTIAGFADRGTISKLYGVRILGAFANSGSSYTTTEYNQLELTINTGTGSSNQARVTKSHAIKITNPTGTGTNVLTEPWSIVSEPQWKSYHNGNFGIGTNAVTNKLTVSDVSNPVKILGLQNNTSAASVLVLDDATGVVYTVAKSSIGGSGSSGLVAPTITTGNTTLAVPTSPTPLVYVHTGGDATYTLPSPSSCAGAQWFISNNGTGTITMSAQFKVGDDPRTTIINKPGACSFHLISDGTQFIAIE